jgi:hypothetical protein
MVNGGECILGKIDYSDLGNLALGIGTAISGYIAATGDTALSVFVLSMAGVVKAALSAFDNYKYKNGEAEPQVKA